MLSELGLKSTSHPIMWYDNVRATSLVSNAVFHSRTKHIKIDVHFMQGKVLAKEFEIYFMPSEI